MNLKTFKNGKYLIISRSILNKHQEIVEKTWKYDLSTGECFRNNGKPLKSLSSALHDVTASDFIESIQDLTYKNYITECFYDQMNNRKFKANSLLIGLKTDSQLKNRFSLREQYFAAGLQNKFRKNFRTPLVDIPKIIITYVKKWNDILDNDKFEVLSKNIAIVNSLVSIDIAKYDELFINTISLDLFKQHCWTSGSSKFTQLINDYNYDVRALINYVYKLYSFEGITIDSSFWNELLDYARMMQEMSVRKWEKYPNNFLTTHRIASRNYNQMKTLYDDELFKSKIQKDYEWTYGEFIFIYPKCSQDIKDEGCQQQNCVASYIPRILQGTCHIVFMRFAMDPEKSVITIEIQNNKPVQCLGTFNLQPSRREAEVLDKYTRYLEKKFNKEDCKKNNVKIA